MKKCSRPTLTLRVTIGMSGIFLVVWTVLVAYAVRESSRPELQKDGVFQFGEIVSQSLIHMRSPDAAAGFVKGMEEVQNKIFNAEEVPLLLAIQLYDKQGRLLYVGPTQDTLSLQGLNGKVQREEMQGREFWVYRAELELWTVVVARPSLSVGWAIGAIVMQLLPYLAISVALSALFVWFSVNRGMRPLREMSEQIAARKPDDLSATGLDVRYEELLPLQRALDSLLAKLRQKVERETSFVQEAAHELRTPMAVVSAQAHVLRLAQDPFERKEAELHLDAALARASHLVEQLLQLAHIGGELDVALAPLDVPKHIARELATLVPSAMQRQIELELDAPDSLITRIERQTFTSILLNLVCNAIRYIDQGGKVNVTLSQQDNHMLLTVTDDGPGIPLEQRELVFERFYRGADHAAQGAGLGLAIVRLACKRLGGNVSLEVGPNGRGCQFLVQLPMT
jgi:two-component system sensor histidine kinase QseC